MGVTRDVADVKLVMGILAQSKAHLDDAHGIVEKHFGGMDLLSEPVAFTFTDYYDEEMGGDITRQYVSFGKLIHPESLREIKILTNDLEEEWSLDGKRAMNLDPGYLTAYSVVLASTKEGPHRVYIGDGIYGQPMLRMQGGAFRPFEFTYPDYADEKTRAFFLKVRERYREQVKSGG